MRGARRHRRRLSLVAMVVLVLAAACQTPASPSTAWNGGRASTLTTAGVDTLVSLAPSGDGGAFVLLDRPKAAVAKLDSSGHWVTTFGSQGWVDAASLPVGGFLSYAPAQIVAGPSGTSFLLQIHQSSNFDDCSGYGVTHLLANGTVDTAWGTGGSFIVAGGWPCGFAGFPNLVVHLAVGTDGRALIGGDAAPVRLTASGQIDPSFAPGTVTGHFLASLGGAPLMADGGSLFRLGDNGTRAWTTVVPGAASLEQAVVSGNSIVAIGTTAAGATVVARLSVAGVLDATFDGDGVTVVTNPFGAASGAGLGPAAVDTSGRVVLPFTRLGAPNSERIVRLTAVGSVDAAFGTGGRIVLEGTAQSAPPLVAVPKRIAPLPIAALGTGIIVPTEDQAGYGPEAVRAPLGLTIYGSTGQPGTTVVPPTFAEENIVDQVVALPDGGAVVAVVSGPHSNQPATRLARLTAAGALDLSFGRNGLTVAVNGGPTLFDGSQNLSLIHTDGSLVLGVAASPTGREVAPARLYRFSDAGVLDSAFGAGGIVSLAEPSASGSPVLSSARRVVVRARPGGYAAFVDRRQTTNGSVYTQDGILQLIGPSGAPVGAPVTVSGPSPYAGNALGFDLAVDGAGRILLATADPASATRMAIRRYSAALVPDLTFGSGGVDRFDGFGVANLQLTTAGRILVGAGSGSVFARLPDGGADPSYGTGGVASSPDLARMVLDASGRVLTLAPGPRIKRFTSAGVLDTSFSSADAGATLTDSQLADAWAIAGAPGGQILLGGSMATGSDTDSSFLAAVIELNGNAPPPISG